MLPATLGGELSHSIYSIIPNYALANRYCTVHVRTSHVIYSVPHAVHCTTMLVCMFTVLHSTMDCPQPRVPVAIIETAKLETILTSPIKMLKYF